MITISQKFHHEKFSDNKIRDSIEAIINSNTLLSMASIKDGKESWINTVYYAYDPQLIFYFLTSPTTQHSKNIEKHPSVAVSIFDTHQNPTDKKSGIQLFGSCHRVVDEEVAEGLRLYTERFTWLANYIKEPKDFDKGILESKLYVITPHTIKLFDEVIFGEEKWVIVSL